MTVEFAKTAAVEQHSQPVIGCDRMVKTALFTHAHRFREFILRILGSTGVAADKKLLLWLWLFRLFGCGLFVIHQLVAQRFLQRDHLVFSLAE